MMIRTLATVAVRAAAVVACGAAVALISSCDDTKYGGTVPTEPYDPVVEEEQTEDPPAEESVPTDPYE